MKIGSIDIERPLLLAPMEDVTDLPFRLICKQLGADIMYTEFVNSDGLVRHSEKTKRKMTFLPEERPIGIQIYGGDPSSMEGAARMAAEIEPDIIDINCGCWVRKVVGHGAGSGLLRDLPRMDEIIRAVVRSTHLPVTVKTRLGWDTESIKICDVARMAEDAGARALTIHCRTRAQGHRGEPDYSWIPRVKGVVSIPVIVNGGIDSPAIAGAVFESTGCDGVMIARGAVQNPWIFRETRHFLSTGMILPEPSMRDRIRVLLTHLGYSVEYKGERTGVIEFRKHYTGYLRSFPGIARLRADLMTIHEHTRIVERLNRFGETLPVEDPVPGPGQLAA